METVSTEDTSNHLKLTEEEPQFVELESDQPIYLKYNHERKNKSFRFTIEGCDSKSDAGVYISTKHIKPKINGAMWICTKYGIKRIDFHTTDQGYKEGMYYLWISPLKRGLNKIKIQVSCFEPIQITEIKGVIEEEIGIESNRFKHHYFEIPREDWKRYEIHISPGWPKIGKFKNIDFIKVYKVLQ